ncbi:MAG: site-specific integrase, partial [Prevotellaceae bacterium]|nr:site-specific integrase [Prevotellaceae bacterium]
MNKETEGGYREPVRLRRKALKGGGASLYLDTCWRGRRRYEFLRLYLVPERSREDREKNRETLRMADAVRVRRMAELQSGRLGLEAELGRGVRLLDFYEGLMEREGRGGLTVWGSCLNHLRAYDAGRGVTLDRVDEDWVWGFRRYLETEARTRRGGRPLAQNTRASYFERLKVCLAEAARQKLVRENPARDVPNMRQGESRRMYLTREEVRRLAQTPCANAEVRRAFLFSCLTGLRHSDIAALTWGQVCLQSGFTRLLFRQRKTKGLEYLDIAPQAATLMGARGKDTEAVFRLPSCHSVANDALRRWVAAAGIDKEITFHCARHTFAVMMLDLG